MLLQLIEENILRYQDLLGKIKQMEKIVRKILNGKMKQQIKKSKHKKDGNAAAHIPPLEHNSNIEETADFSQRQI